MNKAMIDAIKINVNNSAKNKLAPLFGLAVLLPEKLFLESIWLFCILSSNNLKNYFFTIIICRIIDSYMSVKILGLKFYICRNSNSLYMSIAGQTAAFKNPRTPAQKVCVWLMKYTAAPIKAIK
jgi:hypothetical protein